MIRLLSIATLSLLLLPSSYANMLNMGGGARSQSPPGNERVEVEVEVDLRQQMEEKLETKKTNFEHLGEYYEKGEMPTLEDLMGWNLGIQYDNDNPNRAVPNLFVGKKRSYDNGSIFDEEIVLSLIPLQDGDMYACKFIEVDACEEYLKRNEAEIRKIINSRTKIAIYHVGKQAVFNVGKRAVTLNEEIDHKVVQSSFRKYEDYIIKKVAYYDSVISYAYYYKDVTPLENATLQEIIPSSVGEEEKR